MRRHTRRVTESEYAADAPPCRCGHPAAVHEHYRPASDCSLCGRLVCERYRADVPSRLSLLWALVRHCGTWLGYVVRPYDAVADARRWRWQPPAPCGRVIAAGMSPEARDRLEAALKRITRRNED